MQFDRAILLKPLLALTLLGTGYYLGEKDVQAVQANPSVPVAPASPMIPNPPVDGGASGIQNLFVKIADQTMPSVVNIFTTKRGPSHMHEFWGGFFDEPVPLPRGRSVSRPLSLGSGFVIMVENDGRALIVTNDHVIRGADEVKVKFTESAQEKETPAKVIGRDPELDVALLEVRSKQKLVPVKLGDSDHIQVGEWIAAMGNPFGHGHSISHGIVSAKARTLPGAFGRYLQVDAPINPGNSGGPLVNAQGEVIGINNAIDARGPGIGFAIPINSVKKLLPGLLASGHVERGYIGVGIEPAAEDGRPVVRQVMPGTPAAKAGMRIGDVIAAINGEQVGSPTELIEKVALARVGSELTATVERSGKPLQLRLQVERRHSDLQAMRD